jgi:hypothetical protein
VGALRQEPVYRPDPSVRFVPATRESLVALVESINQPQVSIPGKPPQAVQGYLCALRNAGGSVTLHAALWLAESGESVVYVHEPRELRPGDYAAAEAEGVHFLESMGFMLDDLHWRNLAPEAQAHALARIPVFAAPRPAAARAAAAVTAAAPAVARLLAGF